MTEGMIDREREREGMIDRGHDRQREREGMIDRGRDRQRAS